MWLFDWIHIIEERNKILAVEGNNPLLQQWKMQWLWFKQKQKSDLDKQNPSEMNALWLQQGKAHSSNSNFHMEALEERSTTS